MALSNELTNKRSSGIIETNRNTLNMRNSLAINIVEPAAGYKLPNTMIVSNIFHPLEKKSLMPLLATKRIISSIKKNAVMPTSIQLRASSTVGCSE